MNFSQALPENREAGTAAGMGIAAVSSASKSKAAVIAKFNELFHWTFPADSSRESLATMKAYSELRGLYDMAAQIEAVLKS